MDEDAVLLRRFAEEDAEEAFTAIVHRHLPLVFSVARRKVGGDVQLAEEVAQMVFVDVARKAGRLLEHRGLAAWLYTATHFAAAKVVRTERRRRQHEQEAVAMDELTAESTHDREWAAIRPVLDDAMMRLKPAERDAVVLRFFDGRDFGAIGAASGLSESGARMRVERALDKLRAELQRRGVASTMAALGAVLTTHAVAAPPAGLAASVATAALSGAAATGGALTLTSLIAMTKVQIGVATGIVLASAAVIGVQQNEQAELRREIAALAQSSAAVSSQAVDVMNSAQALEDFTARRRAIVAEVEALRSEILDLNAQWEAKQAQHSVQRSNPAPSVDRKIYELNELDRRPVPLTRARPEYPEAFKKAGLWGNVRLEILLDEKGEVLEVKSLEATHPEFAAAAMEAVLAWKFEPGMRNGESVSTRVIQPLDFSTNNYSNWF